MKKFFSLALILGLGILLVAGCQQATTSEPTQAPSGSSVANMTGDLLSITTEIDGTARGLMGIASVANANSVVPKAATADDLTYSDGWWRFSTAEGIVAYDFKARAYTALGVEIIERTGLSATNKLVIVATLTMGSSLSYQFGTDSSPLTFDGILSGTKSLNGTVSLQVTESGGKSYALTLLYSGVTLDSYGYAKSGSVTFAFSSSDYVAVSATIVFNGDRTATLTFTAPPELAGLAYNIDLTTGDVTAASL